MASLKKCVENMCKSCTYDSTQAGSWRSQTEACTVTACPLWEVRPVTMESTMTRRKSKNDADGVVDKDIADVLANLEDDDE